MSDLHAIAPTSQLDEDARARREDDELLKLLVRWERLRAEYILADIGSDEKSRIAHEIESLDGCIIRLAPHTFDGAQEALRAAHAILTARDSNNDAYLGDGPASQIIARVIYALGDETGALVRPRERPGAEA